MPARTWFWFTAPRAIRLSLGVGVVPLLASGPAVPLLLVTSFKVLRELSRPDMAIGPVPLRGQASTVPGKPPRLVRHSSSLTPWPWPRALLAPAWRAEP
jgi:hypothetical protein